MGLVLGTNCGFVTTSPTTDPLPTVTAARDGFKIVTRDTSQATATTITEVGWFCENASEETNFEVGLYADDGPGGRAATLLFSDTTHAKGTTLGWKTATVNWTISSSTTYWIAIQIDATVTDTRLGRSVVSTSGRDEDAGTTLTDPYAGGGFIADEAFAIYALVVLSAPTTTTVTRIGSTFVTSA